MMCETVSNMPVEEKSSYVLTQDMIDAAMMNEQFSYQEDLESEGESSSGDGSGDQDSQESLAISEIENNVPTENGEVVIDTNAVTAPGASLADHNSPVTNEKQRSALVIETGLDKNMTSADIQNKDQQTENVSEEKIPTCLEETVKNVSDTKQNPILKSMLSNNTNGVIDLCEESEVDDCSEDDDTDTVTEEMLDDELRSVMETNLMAEVGITMKKPVEPPKNDAPRISVKNILHISNHAFNSIPSKSYEVSNTPEQNETQNKIPASNSFTSMNQENNQGQIHINKIAIPHSSFINNQGQRMRCVYLKSSSSLPYVINTPTQTIANSPDLRYVLSKPPVTKQISAKMPAIAALKKLTKNIQPQTLVLPKNAKLLTVAQKVPKTGAPQNGFKTPQPRKKNPLLDAFKSSLLTANSWKTYVPPDLFPELPTYSCGYCNDKYLCRSSLIFHLQRRVFIINYWCQPCKSNFKFYNRCALALHVQTHDLPLHNVDLSNVGITMLSQDIITQGVTSYCNFSELNMNESVYIQSHEKSKTSSDLKTADTVSKTVSTAATQTITSVAGQSKSVCSVFPNSSESPPLNSNVEKSQTKALPMLLPKTPTKIVVSTTPPVQNSTKDSLAGSSTSKTKSLMLICKKISPSKKVNSTPTVAALPPNVVIEAGSASSQPATTTIDNEDIEMVIDDDTAVVPNNEEEELVDVENFDGKSFDSTPTAPVQEKSKRVQTYTNFGTKRTCSECNVICLNIGKHLNGTGRPSRLDLACKICDLILPSKCALKIHTRIHMKIPPYKCPDCGKDFCTWDELHRHLKFSCGHFAKCMRFICKGCKSHFPSENTLAQHIVKHHGKDIFKCSLCPVAFYKKHSLIRHIDSDHSNQPNKSKIGLDYKQCDMCPKKLLPEESYLVHAKEHSRTMIYGYKCSTCNVVYANKTAFIIHQIKEKSKSGNHSFNESTVKNVGQTSDFNSELEDEPLIARVLPENSDDTSVVEKDPLSLDDWEYTQEQKVKEKTEELCIVCKKNSVFLLPGIDLNRQSLCCKQCVKPINSDTSALAMKMSKKNVASRSRPTNRHNQPATVYRSASTDETKNVLKKRRSSDISYDSYAENGLSVDPLAESPPKKRNRRKQNKSSAKGQTHIQGQVIKSRSTDELCHKCSKCKFVSEERESFLKHIATHRTDPNTYQCLECGLCFVVLPSLETHLQMHHGIADVSSYTKNNTASLPKKSSFIEEDIPDNQCRVCYELFDSKASLDKHFRIHGMAFMNRLKSIE